MCGAEEYQFANRSAWLEDDRCTDNGKLAYIVACEAMRSPVSCQCKGYWQRAT